MAQNQESYALFINDKTRKNNMNCCINPFMI